MTPQRHRKNQTNERNEMSQNQSPITLRVGGVYRARDGHIYGPLHTSAFHRNSSYPFSDGFYFWTVMGKLFKYQDGRHDLIEEVTPEPVRSSLIYGAAMVGNSPVPVKEVKETVLYDGPSHQCGAGVESTNVFHDKIKRSRIKIIAIEESK